MKSVQYQCQAIVLKTFKLNEADKILHLYSLEHGPVQAIAKGALRINSGFGSKAQVLSQSDFLIAEGRNLDIIVQSKLIEDFRHIHSVYESLLLAYFIVEIFDHIGISDHNYQEPFNLLNSTLNSLNTFAKNKMSKDFYVGLGIKLLWDLIKMLGYKPDLYACSISHKLISETQTARYFDYQNGGIVSSKAYEENTLNNPYQEHMSPINPETYKLLKFLDLEVNCDINEITILSNAGTLIQSFKLLHKHLEFRLHKEFKSWSTLQEAVA